MLSWGNKGHPWVSDVSIVEFQLNFNQMKQSSSRNRTKYSNKEKIKSSICFTIYSVNSIYFTKSNYNLEENMLDLKQI